MTDSSSASANSGPSKATDTKGGTNADIPHIRIVIQRCEHAVLKVRKSEAQAPEGQNQESQNVEYEKREINRGLIVFVCFFKEATQADVQKLVNTLSTLNICERPPTEGSQSSKGSREKLVNLLELPGDLLLVPQATLSGKPKSNSMQYHAQIGKQDGETLYRSLVASCEELFVKSGAAQRGNKVMYGEYGARQILSTETNGPFTHVLDL